MTGLSRRDWVEVGIYAIVAVVGGLILAAALEIAYAVALVLEGGGFEAVLSETVAAGGVIEPPTTKVIPAAFIVFIARSQVPTARGLFHRRWLAWGLAVGIVVGLVEFLTKLPLLMSDAGGLWLTVCALGPALLLHPLMGLLAAAPTFRIVDAPEEWSGRRRWLAVLVVGVGLAMVIHVWWNTGGATDVLGWIHPDCDLSI